ncbi:hypothetical protein [Paenibacillus turpanensis]|uniref:hypothetical protein n=1 Tax=Paenibacillus turpanensis TaxID=2689078 RepID=UPI0014090C4C|nr:hypothetical protein [Paenibacillus turpanensis]
MNDKLVIIPCAKLISEEMRTIFGPISPVCMPFDDSTLLLQLYETYRSLGYRMVVGCSEGMEMVEQVVRFSELPIEIVNVGNTMDIGHTVWKIISAIEIEETTRLIINYGDTYISASRVAEMHDERSYIVTATVEEARRWTIVDKDLDGHLRFVDKRVLETEQELEAVVGLFKITNALLFKKFLNESIEKSIMAGSESIYDALTLYHEQEKIIHTKVDKNEWVDVGHLDKWFDSTQKLRARSFNQISIDNRRGILTKRSENKSKLIKEIEWYLELPEDLCFLIPRVFSYSLDTNDPYVSMEYYGYQTLAELFVHGRLETGQWRHILSDLKWITTLFLEKQSEYNISYLQKLAAQKEMYVDKTLERLVNYVFHEELKKLSHGCILNGKQLLSLNDCLGSIETLFDWCIPVKKEFGIIHGDFCFSNILYNPQSKIFRLIDPRGSFGTFTVQGDILYDIAKLSHSVRSFYDFIVRDHFYYNRIENCVTYKLYLTAEHRKISELFDDIFLGESTEKRRAVQFIEGILFLSMIPLHHDKPKRQIAMLVTGLNLLTDIYHSYRQYTDAKLPGQKTVAY